MILQSSPSSSSTSTNVTNNLSSLMLSSSSASSDDASRYRHRHHHHHPMNSKGSPTSSSSSSSAAERKVRQVGVKIGLQEDSEILNQVCMKMRQELVCKVWQLPALDSFQWKSLDAPIGLAAAVRSLSLLSNNNHNNLDDMLDDDDPSLGFFSGEEEKNEDEKHEQQQQDIVDELVASLGRSKSETNERDPIVNVVDDNDDVNDNLDVVVGEIESLSRQIHQIDAIETDKEEEVAIGNNSSPRGPVNVEDIKEQEDAAPSAPIRSIDHHHHHQQTADDDSNSNSNNSIAEQQEDMIKLDTIGEFQSIIFEDETADMDEAPAPPIRTTDQSTLPSPSSNSKKEFETIIKQVNNNIVHAPPSDPPTRTFDRPPKEPSPSATPEILSRKKSSHHHHHHHHVNSNTPDTEGPPEAPIRSVDKLLVDDDKGSSTQQRNNFEKEEEDEDGEFIQYARSSPLQHVLKQHPKTLLPTITDENSSSNYSEEDGFDEDNENEEPKEDRRHSFPDKSSYLQKTMTTTAMESNRSRHSTPTTTSSATTTTTTTTTTARIPSISVKDDTMSVGDDDSTVVVSNLSPDYEYDDDETETEGDDEDDCTVVASNVTPAGREKGQHYQKEKQIKLEAKIEAASAEVDSSLYEKWKELLAVIHHLDQNSQRAILGQLMIMANGRSKETRFKMLHQASDSLLDGCRSGGVNTEVQKSAGQMIIFMGQFAKLNSKQRKKFGKWVFGAISELYKPKRTSSSSSASGTATTEKEEKLVVETQQKAENIEPGIDQATVGDCE